MTAVAQVESGTENLISFDIENEGNLAMNDAANIAWEIKSMSCKVPDESSVWTDVQRSTTAHTDKDVIGENGQNNHDISSDQAANSMEKINADDTHTHGDK